MRINVKWLFALVTMVMLVVSVMSACSQSATAPREWNGHALVHHDQVGDACTTGDGRSGYLITAGRDLVCSATQRAPLKPSVMHADQVGDPCIVDGRSGYLISAGRDLVCSAT